MSDQTTWDLHRAAGNPCVWCDAVPGRLSTLVDKDPHTGCWLWVGTVATNGYGVLSIHDRQFKAHRVSYQLNVGPIPDGLEIDHLCRVRNCVNPDHLEPVTGRVNKLRGYSPHGINWRKSACDHGHEFIPENTRIERRGEKETRICRACFARRMRTYRAKAAARREQETTA
jgi:hypothetical protein